MALGVGTRLGGYEITGELGTGGMGDVYRATDTKLDREVAVKTLPSALAQDPDRLARFEREAKLLAALNHPHIAAIYGLDEHEGRLYLAMELVEGQTLEERLEKGSLPVEDALHVALQIAEALEAAHEKGIVHRDLKPANIMLTADGQVKVLDFGLAKASSADANEPSAAHSPAARVAVTQQGLILGTAGYMSPEQASGQATDQRADIWAFGVVLYEMLTGLPLFSGESVPHILAEVLKTEPDWSRLPKSLHPRLKLLLELCLDKKARNRYHSIADVRIEIEKVLSDPHGILAIGAAGPPHSRRIVPIAAASMLLGALLVGFVAWGRWPSAQPPSVISFEYEIPRDHGLRYAGRSVLALSRDGRRFVYNATDGLYVRSMDDLEARPIAGTEENLTNPFFSPDGRSVAYFAFSGQLKRTSISGGAPVVIADGVTNLLGATWEPDGTVLYGQPQGIFRVSASGGKPSLIIPAKQGEKVYGPELLPDGDSVLFSATTGNWDEARVVVQSLSTGKRKVLVQGGSDAHYVQTGHLIYAIGDRLFASAFDADRLTMAGVATPLVQGVMRALAGLTAAANYAVSANGTLVYVSGSAPAAGATFVWVDREGHEEPLGLDPCPCTGPAVSPDGARVAFSEELGPGGDLWLWSLAEHRSTRLTFAASSSAFAQSPLWTPDGRRVAYATQKGIFWQAADGTGMAERLLEGSNLVPYAWTKDGGLLFTYPSPGKGDVDIGELAAAGDRERRPLLATKFNEERPALSPDGRWLAYQSDDEGHYEIYVRPFPDVAGGKWQVSEDGGEEPHWSRDGRSLFFVRRDSLMAATVETASAFAFRTPKAVLDLSNYVFVGTARQYDVSPDGQRILVAKAVTAGDSSIAPPRIVVTTSWSEELRSRVPAD